MSTDTDFAIEDRWLRLAPDATLVVDQSGRIVRANGLAERLLGYPREHSPFSRWRCSFPPACGARTVGMSPIISAIPAIGPWALARSCGACDGTAASSRRQISLNSPPILTGHHVLVAVRDVSEDRQI